MAGGQIGQRVADVFDHFHVQNHIKLFARCRQIFGGGKAVVDGKARGLGVHLRHRNVARRCISPHHFSAQSRHGF